MPKRKIKSVYIVNVFQEYWNYEYRNDIPYFQSAKEINENCEVVLGYEKALKIGVKKFLNFIEDEDEESSDDNKPTSEEVLNGLKTYNEYVLRCEDPGLWKNYYSVSILKKKLHK